VLKRARFIHDFDDYVMMNMEVLGKNIIIKILRSIQIFAEQRDLGDIMRLKRE
jgi:hypothetical protein